MLRIARGSVPRDFGDQVILCPATMCHNEAETEVLAKHSLTRRITNLMARSLVGIRVLELRSQVVEPCGSYR